jgi:hypothetical protein
VVICYAIYGASLSYEQAEQIISSLSYEGLKHSLSLLRVEVLSYRNSYFPNVDKTPLPSATINLVDVASVQSKDSIPSALSKDHEGFSPKAKFYITAYVCVAIICFVATGYFPFLYFFGYNKKFGIINNFQ